MTQVVVSLTIQNYLRMLAERSGYWTTMRLFNGVPAAVQGRLCMDAQVPVLATPPGHLCDCSLVAQVSYFDCGSFHQDVLHFECHYDPGEVFGLGPAYWNSLADTLAYQMVSQLVEWRKTRGMVTFMLLEATTSLKPNRQRFYV